MRLTTTCSGKYNTVSSRLSDLLCESPAGGGDLRLRGMFELPTDGPSYDLTLEADNLPLAAMVRLLRQAKKNIPSDLIASGTLSGEFRAIHHVSESSSQNALTQWTGTGQAIGVRLSSNANNVGKPGSDQIVAGTIPLALLAANSEAYSGKQAGPPEDTRKGSAPHSTKPANRAWDTLHQRIPAAECGRVAVGHRLSSFSFGGYGSAIFVPSGKRSGAAGDAPSGGRFGQAGRERIRRMACIFTSHHFGNCSIAQCARCGPRSEYAD